MVDILGVVFKRFCSQESSNLEIISYPKSSALVVGDGNISRSLLFLTAVTAASELGIKVLYFTSSRFQSLPVSLQGSTSIGVKPECLKKIRFVYPSTLEELLKDVASLHELVSEASVLPSLIIVEGLEKYVHAPTMQDWPKRDAQSTVAHVVALLHDTASFLTQHLHSRAENQGPCRVIVSFCPEWQSGSDALVPCPLLSVLDRYLRVRFTLDKVRRDEELSEWMIYLSGSEQWVEGEGNGKEWTGSPWRAVMQSNGALEFWPVTGPKEETPQGQKPTTSESSVAM